MIETFSSLERAVSNGTVGSCFVDTSALFSATYENDLFNNSYDSLFNTFAAQNIPLFINVNVRAEFLENHRRVLIAECLIDFLEDFQNELDGVLAEKLKSHRTSYRRKVEEKKSHKLEIQQIKAMRNLLLNHSANHGENGWNIFCKNYLAGKIEAVWQEASELFNLTLISIRQNDLNQYLNRIPTWEDTMRLMGTYGLPSSDAMILNMFICSKIPALLTSDMELAQATVMETKGQKQVFTPNALIESEE